MQSQAGDFILIIQDPLTVSSSVSKNTAPESLDDSYEVIHSAPIWICLYRTIPVWSMCFPKFSVWQVIAVHATGIIIARPWPNESSDKLFLWVRCKTCIHVLINYFCECAETYIHSCSDKLFLWVHCNTCLRVLIKNFVRTLKHIHSCPNKIFLCVRWNTCLHSCAAR